MEYNSIEVSGEKQGQELINLLANNTEEWVNPFLQYRCGKVLVEAGMSKEELRQYLKQLRSC
jgi:hypothetical protein